MEEISEAEKAKEQRRENKRLKKKKRKENKAKLNEETKQAEEEDEKLRCSEEKDSLAVNGLDIDDCSSEKSSSDGSQASPGKSDQRSTTPPTPSKLSPCSSLSDSSFHGLLKHVEDTCPDEEKPPVTCTTKDTLKNTCNSGNSCVEASAKTSNNNNKTPTKQHCDQNEGNCKGCEKEAANSPPWLEANSRKGSGGGGDCRNSRNSSENHQQHGKGGNHSVSTSKNNSGKDCECEGPPNAKQQHNKKNGYYNNSGGGLYKNGHYINNSNVSSNKRNGHNDCRSSPSVGPRFSRYENQQQQQQQQHRLKEQQKQTDQCAGPNDSCVNGNSRGRSAGKKGGKQGPYSKVMLSCNSHEIVIKFLVFLAVIIMKLF